MPYRCAILDDYQNVALQFADWGPLKEAVEIKVFNRPLGDPERVIAALGDFTVICLMRERTPFLRPVIERLPNLKLLLTSGMRNNSIDLVAAKEHNVVVCGTESTGNPPAELTWGLILELARKVGYENARLKAGERWQTSVGVGLSGKTLGVVGLGKLGTRVAEIARAFDMQVVAWSQNLTREQCEAVGATLVSKEDLFRQSDFVSIHLQLSPRTRGLIGANELGLMKPTAFLINTARGPIVDQAALIDALDAERIAGAGLDVFDIEPLPIDHPLRRLDNAVLTPHLGYVTEENYRRYYGQMVENIRAWLDGRPKRVMTAN